jgi:predicted transcriptional regulator of viral defense system
MNSKPDYDHIYEIAEEQAGYFTARQARDAGFSWERLSSNASTGRFLRINRGIYRLAQFPGSAHEDLFVAWLRTGKNSVISHESALSVYNLTDTLPGEIHVIIPRTASRRREGIRLHTNHLKSDDVILREGLPVTSVARTIADVITGGLAEEQVNNAIHEALQRGMVDQESLLEEAKIRGGRVEEIIRHALRREEP